jgi:hypothetical protein
VLLVQHIFAAVIRCVALSWRSAISWQRAAAAVSRYGALA